MSDALQPVENPQTTQNLPVSGRERQLAALRKNQFSKDRQPSVRGRQGPDGGKLYRWAATLPAPEFIVANLRKMFPGISPNKKITLDEARRMRIFLEACQGNVQASKEIDDRLYGKARESIDHTSLGDKLRQTIITVSDLAQKRVLEEAIEDADVI